MQDLKEMGDQFELRLGNRDVALVVGALFLVLVLAFALGVIMGKRLYGPVQGQPIAQVTSPPATSPGPAEPAPEPATAPAAVTTGEQYTFPETLKNLPATGSTPTSPPPAAAPVTAHAQPTTAPASAATPESTTRPPAATPPSAHPAPKTEPITEPEPPSHTAPPAKTTPAAKSPGGAWSIQVSAVPDKKRAEDYMKSLKAKGLEAWISTVDGTDGKTYYRVRIGHFPTVEEATAEMKKLQEANSIPKDSFVRK